MMLKIEFALGKVVSAIDDTLKFLSLSRGVDLSLHLGRGLRNVDGNDCWSQPKSSFSDVGFPANRFVAR